MAMAALSPNSVLATPIQVNPQVKTDVQASVPQAAQEAQRSTKAIQTDTITISPQALKMADDRNAVVQEAARKADEQKASQLAGDRAAAARNPSQSNALNAYAAIGGQ